MATEANHFTFEGNEISGSLDTSTITGGTQASIRVDGTDVNDVTIERTSRGFEVSGIVSQIPDDRTISVTVFVPAVNIDQNRAAIFAGVALVTTARQSFGGPGLVVGAIHSYDVRPVAGQASTVQSLTAGNC
jgi:hypothetical protein